MTSQRMLDSLYLVSAGCVTNRNSAFFVSLWKNRVGTVFKLGSLTAEAHATDQSMMQCSCKFWLAEKSHALQSGTIAQSSGTALHARAQHSTAQHSTAQHSTAQHSTAQHSTAPAVNVAGRWAIILGEGYNPGALVSSLAYNAELCIFNLLQLLEVFSQSRIQDVPFPPQIIEADSLDFSACSQTSTSTSAGEQHQTVHVCHQVALPQRKQTQISAGSIGTQRRWTQTMVHQVCFGLFLRSCQQKTMQSCSSCRCASMPFDASRQECTTQSEH